MNHPYFDGIPPENFDFGDGLLFWSSAWTTLVTGRNQQRRHCNVGPPNDSVQLVNTTPITMVYDSYFRSIHGVYKPIMAMDTPYLI